MSLAPPLTDPILLASQHNLLAAAHLAEYRLADALGLLEDALVALSSVKRSGRDVFELRASIIAKVGACRLLAGETQEAIRVIDATLPYLSNEDDRAEALLDLALAHLMLGLPAAAEQVAREALDVAFLPRHLRNAHHLLGEICRASGRYEEAGRHLDVVAGFYSTYDNARAVIGAGDLITTTNWKR